MRQKVKQNYYLNLGSTTCDCVFNVLAHALPGMETGFQGMLPKHTVRLSIFFFVSYLMLNFTKLRFAKRY